MVCGLRYVVIVNYHAVVIVHTCTDRFKVYYVSLLIVMFPSEITLLPATCNV